MHLVDYFKKECNYTCEMCKKARQKDFIDSEFKYCPKCHKVVCHLCSSFHIHQNLVSIDHMYSNPEEYTQNDSSYKTTPTEPNDQNNYNRTNLYNTYKPKKKDIQILKDKNNELKKKIKSLRLLIKINDILVNTYEKQPKNYMNNKNIVRLSSMLNNEDIENQSNIDDNENVKRIKEIQRSNLGLFNERLNCLIKGNETFIRLSFKQIDDFDLKIFTTINFRNLEELYLNNNSINDLSLFSKCNFPYLKVMDLSHNKITDLTTLRNFAKREINLEFLYLNNNKIKNIDVLDENLFPEIEQIDLEGNDFNYNTTKNKEIIKKYNYENRQIIFINNFNSKYSTKLNKDNTYINLSSKKIQDDGFKLLSKIRFSELNELDLSKNEITNIIYIKKLLSINNKLKLIILRNNCIEDITPLEGAKFNKLQKLDLSENNIKISSSKNKNIIDNVRKQISLILEN